VDPFPLNQFPGKEYFGGHHSKPTESEALKNQALKNPVNRQQTANNTSTPLKQSANNTSTLLNKQQTTIPKQTYRIRKTDPWYCQFPDPKKFKKSTGTYQFPDSSLLIPQEYRYLSVPSLLLPNPTRVPVLLSSRTLPLVGPLMWKHRYLSVPGLQPNQRRGPVLISSRTPLPPNLFFHRPSLDKSTGTASSRALPLVQKKPLFQNKLVAKVTKA
jgi:hypothetical protein